MFFVIVAVVESFTSYPRLLFGDLAPEPSQGTLGWRLAVYVPIGLMTGLLASYHQKQQRRHDAAGRSVTGQ